MFHYDYQPIKWAGPINHISGPKRYVCPMAFLLYLLYTHLTFLCLLWASLTIPVKALSGCMLEHPRKQRVPQILLIRTNIYYNGIINGSTLQFYTLFFFVYITM